MSSSLVLPLYLPTPKLYLLDDTRLYIMFTKKSREFYIMLKLNQSLLLLSLSLTSISLSNCQHNFHSGTFLSNDNIESISSSQNSKIELEQKFGSPDIISPLSPNVWYYVYRNSSKRAFLPQKLIEQKIVKITFNDNNIVSSVEMLDNSSNNDIKIIQEYIKTNNNSQNPLKQYISNIGKFNKHNQKSKRR